MASAADSALYAVTADGPQPLAVPRGARGLDGLYDGLVLGVYSAFRTFEHCKFLDLEHHLERTRRSMRRLGWDYVLDEARLRRALNDVCVAFPSPEMRVRLDVLAAPARSRGSASRELIALAPFTPPPDSVYRDGVAVVTTRDLTRDDPLTKTADFVERRKRVEAATPDAYERLIVRADGAVLEGFSSNFYVVVDGSLRTAGEGVLEGVTRAIVLDIARASGVPLDLAPPALERLPDVDEAAISSSSRGLVPVVRIDGVAVGDGRPGPVITMLRDAYDAHVARTIRPAV